MSEFKPTQAEKDALSYLDWDDAALGRFTKHVACTLEKLNRNDAGLGKVTAASAAMMLVGMAFECNAGTLKLSLDGHTHKEIPTGDWLVTVKRTKSPMRQVGRRGSEHRERVACIKASNSNV